jgi:pilus assembly protein CpaE
VRAAPAAADAPSGAEERRQFRAFVQDEPSRKVVDQAAGDLMIPNAAVQRGGIADAVRELGARRSPRILVVDITGVDLPLSAVNELAEVCEPGVTVIAIGDQNDVGLFRDLINHGVSDYLVKPLTPGLVQKSLLAVIDSASQGRSSQRLGRLIAVTGTRGGVGATLVATSLAWSIAHRRRRRCALLDLDLQFGTAALALDLEPSNGLREALEHPSRIDGSSSIAR